MDKIKIGIVGYGNIGRGVEQAKRIAQRKVNQQRLQKVEPRPRA